MILIDGKVVWSQYLTNKGGYLTNLCSQGNWDDLIVDIELSLIHYRKEA